MSYKICPKIKYQYDCNSIVVYNDIYSDLCVEEGESGDTISALSFRLRRYNEAEYLAGAITVTSPQTATTWGTITTDDLVSYRYYNTALTPTNSTTYSIQITFSDSTSFTATYTATVPSDTWITVFEDLISDINTDGNATASYDNVLESVFIGNGTKVVSGVVITSHNSDTALESPATISNTFTNDVYVVEVSYTVDGDDLTREYYLPIYCTIKQCIYRLIGRIPELENCSKCNNDCINYIMVAAAMMYDLQIKEINNEEDIIEIQEIIAKLESVCDDEECQCY
jgi:hypothetical protein